MERTSKREEESPLPTGDRCFMESPLPIWASQIRLGWKARKHCPY